MPFTFMQFHLPYAMPLALCQANCLYVMPLVFLMCDKRINSWPAHRELPWECQTSASRELAQRFTAAIAKA